MKVLLIAILINATSGAPVAMHVEGKHDTFQQCGDAAQAKGMVLAHDNVATEYVCRKVNDDGSPVNEVKVGPDDSPWEQWLKKRMAEQTEKNS